MIVEKIKEEKQEVSSSKFLKDELYIVKNIVAKDNFELCMIIAEPDNEDKKVKVLLFKRVKNFPQYFQPFKDTELNISDLLFKPRGVKVKEVEEDGEKSTQICFSNRKYKTITERVAIEVEDELKKIDESESDIELDDAKLLSKQAIRKLKKSKYKIKGKKSKSKSNKKSKGRSKTPKKFKFRRGKDNIRVHFRQKCKQLESKSSNPNYDCCIRCNDKEIIRAIRNDDKELIDKIIKNPEKISTINPMISPMQNYKALQYCLELDRQQMFRYIFELEKQSFDYGQLKRGFVYQDTGFNDKYAYGTATQKVQLGRGNREGNNAFTYDDYQNRSRLMYEEYFLAKYLDEDKFNLINSEQNNLRHKLLQNTVQKAVMMGNYELSKSIMKYCVDSDGYNLNEFHYLSLAAKTAEEISHIKRINVSKKSLSSFRDITPAHCAAINPNGDVLRYMLEVSGDLFINDADMRKPIHYAACAETDAGLQVLLNMKCDTRITDADKMTPVMYAARAGRSHNIKLICEDIQQNLSLKSKYGAAPIHYAAQFNNYEALKELIYQGADVNQACSKRVYPLMLASQIGNLEMVEFLLSKGAKIIRTDAHGRTSLIYAVMNGHLSVASVLLQKGSEFDRGDRSNNTPLHYACAYGYYEMIPLLIEAGADPNKVNDWNYSPLLVALIKGHMRCVKVLLDCPMVDVNIRDDKGRSFLISLILKLDPEQEELVVQLVKEKGADLNQRDLAGNTALHVLASRKFEEYNVEAKNYLKYLEEKSNYDEQYKMYYNLLIKFNSDINDLNFDEQTPLEIAIINQNWLFVDLAIKNQDLKISIPQRQTHTLLNSCRYLLLKKNGYLIFEQIIEKIENLKDFENIFNEKGFNFLHSFMQFFVNNSNWESKIQQIDTQLTKLNNLHDQCERNQGFNNKEQSTNQIKNLKEVKQRLQEKIQIKNQYRQKFYEFYKQNFIKILDCLMNREVDFSKPIKTIISKIKKKYESQWVSYQKNKINFDKERLKQAQVQEMTYKNVVNNQAGSTILHILMKNPSHTVFKKIYQYMKDQQTFSNNVQNHFGETLIYTFCKYNAQNFQILKYLLLINEDPNICNIDQIYPIHNLCEQNKLEAFKILCKEKIINLDSQNKQGKSALLIISKLRLFKHLQILIEENCDINIQDKEGMNALHIAINNSKEQDANFEYEDYLIDNGIDLNALDKEQRNPIHYFFVKKNDRFINDKIDPIDCFEFLLVQQKLEIQNKDIYGNTPLHYACQRGAFLCASKLSKIYNDLNLLNINQNTPLNMSLIFDHTNIAIMLLQMGCSVHFKIHIYNQTAAKQYKELQQKNEKMEIEESEKILKEQDFDFQQIFLQQKSSGNRHGVYRSRKAYKSARRKNYAYGGFNNNFNSYNNRFGGYNNNNNSSQNYFAEHNKVYTEKELEKLNQKNFITKKFSTFTHSCNRNDESLKYLIIDNGFPIHTAIKESLKFQRYHYSYILFNKKLHQNKQQNDEFYVKKDKKLRTIVHHFCRYFKKNDDEDLFKKLLNQLIDKNFDFKVKDQNGQNGLHIIAQHNYNVNMINKLIELGVDPLDEDDMGNNMFSLLLQNENLSYLKQEKFLISNQNINQGFQTQTQQSKVLSFQEGSTQNPLNLNTGSQNLFNLQNTGFQNQGNFTAFGSFQQSQIPRKRVARKKTSKRSVDDSFSQINFKKQLGNLNIQNKNFQEFYYFFKDMLNKFQVDENYLFQVKRKEKEYSYSLLSYAITILKNIDLGKLFIESDHDINFQNQKGETIFSYAIKNNDPILLKFILSYQDKINFNVIDKNGNSYVHVCVMPLKCGTFQNIELLEILCDQTEINQRNKFNQTPLDLAERLKNDRLKEYLQTKNGKYSNVSKYRLSEKKEQFFESYISKLSFEEDYQNYVQEYQKNINFEKILKKRKKLDSRIQGDVEILKDDNGKPYDILLVKVDINYGQYSQNVYYKMQIAKDKLRQIYILFTNWGRIGTSGQHQLTPFFKKEQCIQEFCKVFKSKTGNVYTDDTFQRKTRKYSLVKIVQKRNGVEVLGLEQLDNKKTPQTKLPDDVYDLFKDLFNYEDVKKIYSQQELDEDLMPFGNLEYDQLKKAKLILEEIQEKLKKLEINKKDYTSYELFNKYTDISDDSNKVFEILPMERNKYGPLMAINKQEAERLMHKINTLQNLTFLKKIFFASYYKQSNLNPIDYCFNLVNIGIKSVQKDEDFFNLIKKYLKGSKFQQDYSIDKIFKIEQKNQQIKYEMFEQAKNVKYVIFPINKTDIITSFANGFQKRNLNNHLYDFGNNYYLFDQVDQVRNITNQYDNKGFYFILSKLILDDVQQVKGKIKNTDSIKRESKVIQLIGKLQKPDFQNVVLRDKAVINIGKNELQKLEGDFYQLNYSQNSYDTYVVEDESLIDFKYLIKCTVNIE